MEKKSGRSVQPVSKGAIFDKKNQDNNGKLWAKGAIRRESASGSLSVKSDSLRKNPTQRFAKRPRPRGRPDEVARNETSSLEEQQAEVGSVFQPGSKKQSLNHLLNFTYAPRNGELRQFGNRSPYSKHGNHSLYMKKHKYVKEHFLQANCQFIVNTSGDYKQYLNNPDALVEWNYIEQINVQVNDSPSCPICLHPPGAAKITRCGHIYCWSCILHYLSLTDKPHQKCPICYENVCKDDLKSVVVIPHNTFNIGETITFKLMKRNENSLTPYPAEENICEENSLMNFSEEQPIQIYSKLLLAKNSDILTIVNRESRELQYQLEHEEESEKCFIEEAIVYLKERETRVIADLIHDMDLTETCVEEFGGESSPGSFSDAKTDISEGNRSPTESNSKYIYFYQACDGQHIYIHSINVKMLKHTYGSLEHAPNTITAKILAKEGDSMTEDHRKCYKYLAHLPVTCSFDTLEIELNFPVVSRETLDFFRGELEKRKRQRVKKAKEEKRREKRITEEENIKIYKKHPPTFIPLESTHQFPTFGTEPVLEEAEGISQNLPDANIQEHNGPSFAKMAATTRTASNPWPNLKSAAIPIVPCTTGKMKELSVISGRRRYNSNISNSDDQESSDHEMVPEPRATFGDAIAQALQMAAKSDLPAETSCLDEKKKKKKCKKKIILSTSLGYSGN